MESSITAKPDWLNDEVIKELKQAIVDCPNPYTEEDYAKWVYDSEIDIKKSNAYKAKRILEKYGLLDDQEDKPNE